MIDADQHKLSKVGITPEELYDQERPIHSEHHRIRSRKDKMVEAPPMMWHIDRDLLDIDLDEMVGANDDDFEKELNDMSHDEEAQEIDQQFLNIEK